MYFLLYFLCAEWYFMCDLTLHVKLFRMNTCLWVSRHDILLYISVIFRANIYVSYRVSQRALFSMLRLINGIMRSRCTLLWIHTEKCFLPYFIIACVWHEAYNIHVDYQLCLQRQTILKFPTSKVLSFQSTTCHRKYFKLANIKMLSRENLWILHSSKLRK